MAISGDYANPVTVNGFSCKNCTEVDLAKKNIDPAHPQDGPFGVNAKSRDQHGPAIRFGGSLQGAAAANSSRNLTGTGTLVSLSV